jgi:hypothetical protein
MERSVSPANVRICALPTLAGELTRCELVDEKGKPAAFYFTINVFRNCRSGSLKCGCK